MKLTEKKKWFCREFMIDFNGTQAAIRAEYSKKTAAEQASRLLSNVNIQEYISELQEEAKKRNEITIDMVVQELAVIAFQDSAKLFEGSRLKEMEELPENVTRAISEVTVTRERVRGDDSKENVSEIVKIKGYDKKGALDSLMKHLGGFEKDNKREVDLTGSIENKWTIEFVEAEDVKTPDTK